jgi:acetylornithine/N-succinyldiaminopimelate aminotransferase
MKHILKSHEIIKTDFIRAEGSYLFDPKGKKYIDFEAGIWCTALGHSHSRINQVMLSQIEQVMHLGTRFPSMLAEEAAMEVLDIAGIPGGKCLFLSSGSEAVEFGVQAARRITGKPLLLTFSSSYLSAYGTAGRKSPDQWRLLDWSQCDESERQKCCEDCEQVKALPFDQIGGFILEPGSSSGQVRFPPNGLVQLLADRVKRSGGLIVVNEVTTGMGRTGEWFGYEHYDLQPDIVAIGKGLGNGYPVSAVAVRPEVAEKLEDGVFRYAQSHQNDPLGCAVAREVIRMMREERLVERSRQVGAVFLEKLNRLVERKPALKEARGRGLMIALEFESSPGPAEVSRVFQNLFEEGFIVGCHPGSNLLRFLPPLTIAEQDIDALISAITSLV